MCTSPIYNIYSFLLNFYLFYLVERINEELLSLKKDGKRLLEYKRKEEMKVEERGRERKRRREVRYIIEERERDKVNPW